MTNPLARGRFPPTQMAETIGNAGTGRRSVGGRDRREDFFAALAAAKARKAAAVRLTPPATASPASVAAAASSVLADIGKEVLVAGTFTAGLGAEDETAPSLKTSSPGVTFDTRRMVVIRARSQAELDRCIRARTEQINVLTRAKRSAHALELDTDELDEDPNVAHLYVTFDDPGAGSRRTLAVARVVMDPVKDPPGPPRAFAAATRLLSTRGGVERPVLRACVDRFVATGLAMFPHDPVKQPAFVRELLLEGCHEVLRRAGFGGTAASNLSSGVSTMEYGLLTAEGTLPASASVVMEDDTIHDNEEYIKIVDPSRLGGAAARGALKLFVIELTPPPPALTADQEESRAKTPTLDVDRSEGSQCQTASPQPHARRSSSPPSHAPERILFPSIHPTEPSSKSATSASTVEELAERAAVDAKVNAVALALDAQRAASVAVLRAVYRQHAGKEFDDTVQRHKHDPMNKSLEDVAAALNATFIAALTRGSKSHEGISVAGLVGGGVGGGRAGRTLLYALDGLARTSPSTSVVECEGAGASSPPPFLRLIPDPDEEVAFTGSTDRAVPVTDSPPSAATPPSGTHSGVHARGLSPLSPNKATERALTATSPKRLSSVRRLEGIMEAARTGHMLVVPCARLAPLIPNQGVSSPPRRKRKNAKEDETQGLSQATKPVPRKPSVYGAMSHRKLLKIAAAHSTSDHAGAKPWSVPCADALTNHTREGDGDTIHNIHDPPSTAETTDQLLDVLDSMYQAAGPSGVLLAAGVTRRRTPCGRYDAHVVEMHHDRRAGTIDVNGNVSASGAPPAISYVPVHQVLWKAAEVGLLLDPSGCFVAPDAGETRGGHGASSLAAAVAAAAPYRGVAVARLRRTGYSIRRAGVEDIDALVAVEKTNWGSKSDMCTPRATIEDRIVNNRDCNLVVQADDGSVKGGVYFQMVPNVEAATVHDWHNKEKARRPEGAYVQLMDIHVCQEFSARLGRAVGNELREFVLNVALHIPGVVGVCAVTRTRGFRAKQRVTGVAYDDYVMQQNGRHDRGLLFHTGGGADVVRPVQNWRPADHENDGKGTLIVYDLAKIRAQRLCDARPPRDDTTQLPSIVTGGPVPSTLFSGMSLTSKDARRRNVSSSPPPLESHPLVPSTGDASSSSDDEDVHALTCFQPGPHRFKRQAVSERLVPAAT